MFDLTRIYKPKNAKNQGSKKRHLQSGVSYQSGSILCIIKHNSHCCYGIHKGWFYRTTTCCHDETFKSTRIWVWKFMVSRVSCVVIIEIDCHPNFLNQQIVSGASYAYHLEPPSTDEDATVFRSS